MFYTYLLLPRLKDFFFQIALLAEPWAVERKSTLLNVYQQYNFSYMIKYFQEQ